MKTNDIYTDLKKIDRLIHEPSRIAILSLLLVVEEADFVFAMNKTGLSQGNLSSHLAKLQESGLIEVTKTFKGKRPQTILKISPRGRDEFLRYIMLIKKILKNF